MKKKYPEGTAIPSGYEIEKFLKISVLLTQSNQNRINNQFTNTRKMLQMYKEIAGRVLQKQVFLTFLVLLMMQTSAFGQKDSKMSINYSDSQLKSKKLTNLNLKNALITTALDTILKGTGFTYQIRDNYVIVTEQKSVAPSVVKNIRGKVVDEN